MEYFLRLFLSKRGVCEERYLIGNPHTKHLNLRSPNILNWRIRICVFGDHFIRRRSLLPRVRVIVSFLCDILGNINNGNFNNLSRIGNRNNDSVRASFNRRCWRFHNPSGLRGLNVHDI